VFLKGDWVGAKGSGAPYGIGGGGGGGVDSVISGR